MIYSTTCFAQVKDSIVFEYHNNISTWQNVTLNVITYNNQCLIESSTNQPWDTLTKSWATIGSRRDYTYDNAGNLIEELTSIFIESNNSFRNFSRYVYSYEIGVPQKTTLFQKWDTLGNQWLSYYRVTDIFDNNGNTIITGDENIKNGLWTPQSKRSFEYNSFNEIIATLQQQWENNDWKSTYKTKVSYDSGYKKIQRGYNFNANNWAINDRFIDQHTKAINQYFSNNKWLDSYKYTYEYNSNNKQTASTTKSYDMITDTWNNVVKTKNDYYQDGSLKSEMQQWWDVSTKSWYFNLKATYTHNGCIIANTVNAGNILRSKHKETLGEINILDLPSFPANGRQAINRIVLPLSGTNVAKMQFDIVVSLSAKPVVVNMNSGLDLVKNSDIFISPNPSKTYFIVSPGKNLTNGILRLTDLNGRLIMQQKLSGSSSQKIILPYAQPGVYLVTITDKENNGNAKLIVQ